ncbi:hypothetical protein E4185_16825 [Aeromonas media]|uniref:glycoside hydrolase family protein n=1 Tax=Aeromonas media TaxID=651 RepID=UPI00148B2884|nr:glycoside hydrolase family protein [Aeromonas media]QJT27563.1 hypothetical protein E4185_16825 [Aeromonas media]
MNIERMLIRDEGSKLSVYWDTEGYPTIGIGHLIIKASVTRDEAIRHLDHQLGCSTQGVISHAQQSMLFGLDLALVHRSIKNQRYHQIYNQLDPVRQAAIQNMVFQLGAVGVAGFKNMWKSLEAKDWEGAKKHALNSRWAKQTPNRAKRVTDVLCDGNFDSYK